MLSRVGHISGVTTPSTRVVLIAAHISGVTTLAAGGDDLLWAAGCVGPDVVTPEAMTYFGPRVVCATMWSRVGHISGVTTPSTRVVLIAAHISGVTTLAAGGDDLLWAAGCVGPDVVTPEAMTYFGPRVVCGAMWADDRRPGLRFAASW